MNNFRVANLNKNHACLKIELMSENAIDIGGPFRDVLTNIAQELETRLPLLRKS